LKPGTTFLAVDDDMTLKREPTLQSPADIVPPNLLEFMLQGWRASRRKPPRALENVSSFRGRRERLSALFPGELLLIASGQKKVRANDTYYPFRPSADFYYLTGCLEPECVLMLRPTASGAHEHVLFVPSARGKTDATFFVDRKRGELWDGYRFGVAENEIRYALSCQPLEDLTPMLAVQSANPPRVRALGASANAMDDDETLAVALAEMRLIKDADEIRCLRSAIAATKRGFEDVIRRLKTAKSERELEGAFLMRARTEGRDAGYIPIVASGANTCIVHWKRNDGQLRKRDLLLLDAGVESKASIPQISHEPCRSVGSSVLHSAPSTRWYFRRTKPH
jgi:Xaa-Pro aminopeptidase